MIYLVKGFPDLLNNPGGTAIFGLSPNMTVTGTGNVSGNFVEVQFGNPGSVKTGWVASDSLVVKGRDFLDAAAFVRECLIAERTINALPQIKPWYISADYILARAIFESQDGTAKLVNAGNKIPGSDAVGPLQVSSAEWQRFLGNGGALAAGYGTGDVDLYLSQVWCAAFTMFTDAESITQEKISAGQGNGQGSSANPPLPSYLEIFLAYLTASPKAAVALAAAAATSVAKGQGAAPAGAAVAGAAVGVAGAAAGSAGKLNDLLKNNVGLTDDLIASLFKARPGLTGTNDGNAKTVGDFVNAASTMLAQGLRDAFTLIIQYAPETITAVVGQGNAPPWLAVAQAEAAKGIKEGTPVGDAEILQYFKSINFQTNTSTTPWCAAFVSFCMKNSGNQVVAASVPPTDPAMAATWKSWGSSLPVNASTTPVGAVVVLAPTEDEDVSGHVGFFVSGDVNTITLLGGNQSNAVKQSTYARTRVAAIRWLDVAQQPAGPVPTSSINLSSFNTAQKQAANIILTEFAAAGFGQIQQVTAVANAWKESSLDPGQVTQNAVEHSVGLFQLNMTKGLGVGHSQSELQDPKQNTDVIIGVCKTVPSFVKAQTLNDAVTAFVRYVERPANQTAEIADRLKKAQSLI